MMRKLAAGILVLLCAMLCGTALADWTCTFPMLDGTPCGYANEDGSEYCMWCGADEPIHGFTAGRSGINFIKLKWYGVQKQPMTLYWAVSGTADWMIL